jgi:hypothetical protein
MSLNRNIPAKKKKRTKFSPNVGKMYAEYSTLKISGRRCAGYFNGERNMGRKSI